MHPKFEPNPPPTEEALSKVLVNLPGGLPKDYLAAMRIANGGQGFIGNRFISLWKLEELLDWNEKYEAKSYAPSLFLIGSNGGGEAYAFNLSKADEAVYRVPFIGLCDSDAWLVAQSFDSLVPPGNLARLRNVL